MKIVIIGNGVAGVTVAKELLTSANSASVSNLRSSALLEIEIYSEENYHYYSRIDLIKLLAGKIDLKDILFYPAEWYDKHGIKVYLNKKVAKINSGEKTIELLSGEKISYDKLVLAAGAQANTLPVRGKEKNGVFTLRTIDDVLKIKEYLKKLSTMNYPAYTEVSAGRQLSTVVIGGGVLGLEAGRSLSFLGTKVTVVEFFNHLLPRQLDEEGADILKEQIKKLGISILLSKETIEILGNEKVSPVRNSGELTEEAKLSGRENKSSEISNGVSGVLFKDGTKIPADLVLFSAGIKPNIELGQTAGLKVNKGMVVDEHLRTSAADIYACGDCTEFQGRIYGIIPAAIEQAKIVAENILSKGSIYPGTIPSNTLKVVGIDLTSIGLISADSPECQEIKKVNQEKGIYKKIVLKEGKIVGAILLGTKLELGKISRLIKEKTEISSFKESLLE